MGHGRAAQSSRLAATKCGTPSKAGTAGTVSHNLLETLKRAGHALVRRRGEIKRHLNSPVCIGNVVIPQRLNLNAHYILRRQ
jgi:hypothetical protein